MKKIQQSIALMALLLIFSVGYSQKGTDRNRAEMKEKIQSTKIEFVKEHLALSEKENKVFIPMYKAYLEEMSNTKNNHRKSRPDFDALSNEEVEKILMERFENRQQKLDIQKAYFEKFKSVMPAKKIAELYKAEQSFRKEMWKKYKEKK